MRIAILIVCLAVAVGSNAGAQQPVQDHGGDDCPMMLRGDEAMGFSHETTATIFGSSVMEAKSRSRRTTSLMS